MNRDINLIVIHCSATHTDRDITALNINAAHKMRGFSCWGYHFYIRKSGKIEKMRPVEDVGAHARGYNKNSIGICYEGGLDLNGKAADTRTSNQRLAMHELVSHLLARYPVAEVAGHRDLSPYKNYNGIIYPWERIRECPCFDVKKEVWE